ncbi:EamA family transporter RarD [Sphingomonas sinipercae]|uniref:EamA family transporter RarD n=1 Tax=Sphingomonas sinipercae TaxID=2714944 RepID=A0A6G7ZLY4_9SPHN|nr:EamA family transporter RarD [Sphingomonas sinipercae]QIL01929.1 EamA family transporter RarD [Sphingomonas sinipercae]
MNPPAPHIAREARRGFWLGVSAYGLWGLLPIYFKALSGVGPVDIVAHRIVWSVPFLLLLLAAFGSIKVAPQVLRNRRTMRLLALTSLLIAVNWLLYVFAVTSGHILAGSLGYYLNPLVNIVLGRVVLKERLSRLQWVAIAVAGAGISGLAVQAAGQLWISLTLAASFATYGLLRKIAEVDATLGLAIETTMLLPFAAVWLAWRAVGGEAVFGASTGDAALLLLAGVATSVPLILFTAAARRLRYSTLGMLQFIAPTLQFVCAVTIYGERFTVWHGIAFGAIWAALALYVASLLHQRPAGGDPGELV